MNELFVICFICFSYSFLNNHELGYFIKKPIEGLENKCKIKKSKFKQFCAKILGIHHCPFCYAFHAGWIICLLFHDLWWGIPFAAPLINEFLYGKK